MRRCRGLPVERHGELHHRRPAARRWRRLGFVGLGARAERQMDAQRGAEFRCVKRGNCPDVAGCGERPNGNKSGKGLKQSRGGAGNWKWKIGVRRSGYRKSLKWVATRTEHPSVSGEWPGGMRLPTEGTARAP